MSYWALTSAAVGYAGGRGHLFRKHDHPAALYLKNLGVVYGQVSKAGWAKLQGAIEVWTEEIHGYTAFVRFGRAALRGLPGRDGGSTANGDLPIVFARAIDA